MATHKRLTLLMLAYCAACGGANASIEANAEANVGGDGAEVGGSADGSMNSAPDGQSPEGSPGGPGWVGADPCGVPDDAHAEQGETTIPMEETRGEDETPKISGDPLATLPGFRVLPGGCSRVFLEMRGPVQVTEHRAPGRLTYRLGGVRVPVRTNRFDLPTDHFATPVGRVRLLPVDDGAELVIELRMPARSKAHLRRSPRGTLLRIDLRQVDRPAAEASSAPEGAS